MSSTNPGSARPRTVVAGNDRRVSSSCSQASRDVDRVEDPPRRRIRRHAPEQAALLTQHRQIRDGLAAVGQQHRQINRDAARLMRRTAYPAQPERLNKAAGQPGLVSEIGQ